MDRVFHPIGQGAFYSESHSDFKVVYDCGFWRKSSKASRLVKQSFREGDIINILFISHFDFDHVSQVKTLKEHCKIQKVILPLLYEEEKEILINFYRSLGFTDLESLLNNPDGFFGEETDVVFIEPDSETNPEQDAASVPVEKLKGRIKGGSQISFSKLDWVYVPHNIEFTSRKELLVGLLEDEGLDVEMLRSTLSYAIENRKKLKEIYDKLEGGINSNSLIVYSGPVNWPYFIKHCRSLTFRRDVIHNVGCVYTGDANLNEFSLRRIFVKYWRFVGTIQVPHHGDIKCFDNGNFDGYQYIYPISYSTNNTYGHPSSRLIAELFKLRGEPILVNENINSTYSEHIFSSRPLNNLELRNVRRS